MHAKQQGNVGEIKIAADLLSQGYYVFKELGDICKADLIVLDESYQPIKIQVKAYSTVNGAINIKSTKAGPNYRFEYEKKHADVYAIYVLDKNIILYLNGEDLIRMRHITIRIDSPKNNQTKKVRWGANLSDFKNALAPSEP